MRMEIDVTERFRWKCIWGALLACLSLDCFCQTKVSANEQRQAAVALEQQGQTVQAATAWKAVLAAQPGDAEAHAHLGLLEARREHYKDAITSYRKALALNPNMPGLRLNLGLALFKDGELKQAIPLFTALLKAAPPSSPDAQRLTALIGLAHFGLGDYTAALPYLKKAAADEPQNLQFRMLLARSCLVAKQYQCVLDTYHEILMLNAESAEADMLAGEALDEMKNTTGAIEQFRAATKADPKEPNVHFGLGYLLWTQNRFEEAAQEFEAELANVPDNAQALAFLADSYMQTNRSERAMPLIDEAFRIDPNIERAHLDLGILYADAGRREDAVHEFQLAAKLAPTDANPHWRLARLYQSMGKKEEAAIEFQKTSSLHKAEEESIAAKLKAAQERGKPAEHTEIQPAKP
jgi:tetratricopeptide (TPR) repeat protein